MFTSCRHILYPRVGVRDNALELVGWALDPVGTALGYVGVDHCGFEVSMAQEFLYGSNVGAGFE